MCIEIKESDIDGVGVFCTEDLEEGDWDYIYGFPVPVPSQYTFGEEDTGKYFEPYPPFRYLNHRDEDGLVKPNCEIQWDEESDQMYIVTLRGITAGEELTIDYGFDPTESDG